MLSINDISLWVNERLSGLIPGIKSYGIAKSAIKGESFAPYIDDNYVGLDDTYPAQSYHKELSVSSQSVNGRAYGDNEFLLQNTYTMSLIVFFNENKIGFKADQLYIFIQSLITGVLKAEGYKTIRVNVTNAILNDGQVWASEYGNTAYKLSGSQRLMQINYNAVILFDKKCIEIPNCKN